MTGSEFADRYAKLRDNERNGDPNAEAERKRLEDEYAFDAVAKALFPTAADAATREVMA